MDWWDAESFAGDSWTSMDEINEWAEKPFPLVTSIGRVVFQNNAWIVLLASFSDTGEKDEGYHAMKIPLMWVKEVRVLT